MNDLIICKGVLKFDPEDKTKKHRYQSSWKKVAMIEVRDDTYQYYQWLIERRFPLIQGTLGRTNWINPPLRGTHVTIINDRIEDTNVWEELKDKYDNKELYFFYNWDGFRNNGEHLYFKVECPMGQK